MAPTLLFPKMRIKLLASVVAQVILGCIAFGYAVAASPENEVSPSHSVGRSFRPFDLPEFCSQIITDQCNTTFSSIDSINANIRPLVKELVKSNYFRHFKLDLDKSCKFWDARHFCATENCAVDVLEIPNYNWSVVSDELQPGQLGKINRTDPSSLEVAETCEDFDYCHIDDGHHCVFVDLVSNPERFTGYGGAESFAVWRAIYAENCFPNTAPMLMDADAPLEQCAVKNVFYRLVSGMHASISVHLSNDFLCPETGEFYQSLRTFMERVGTHNDRLSNIYFNYAVLAEALVRLEEIIPLGDFIASRNELVSAGSRSSSNHSAVGTAANSEDHKAGDQLVSELIPQLASNTLLNTSAIFSLDPSSIELKNEFRQRFKNISAIMDCVGCDRCRMWGKVQTIGYGTALKILFESDGAEATSKLKFRRIEIVALVNTFDRLSKSVEAINNFKLMYLDHFEKVKRGEAQPGDYEAHLSSEGLAFPFAKRNGAPSLSSKGKASASGRRNTPPKREIKIDLPKDSSKEKSPGAAAPKSEFKKALEDVYDALKFVFRSYRDFPALVVRTILAYLDKKWTSFIGRPVAVDWQSPLEGHMNED